MSWGNSGCVWAVSGWTKRQATVAVFSSTESSDSLCNSKEEIIEAMSILPSSLGYSGCWACWGWDRSSIISTMGKAPAPNGSSLGGCLQKNSLGPGSLIVIREPRRQASHFECRGVWWPGVLYENEACISVEKRRCRRKMCLSSRICRVVPRKRMTLI